MERANGAMSYQVLLRTRKCCIYIYIYSLAREIAFVNKLVHSSLLFIDITHSLTHVCLLSVSLHQCARPPARPPYVRHLTSSSTHSEKKEKKEKKIFFRLAIYNTGSIRPSPQGSSASQNRSASSIATSSLGSVYHSYSSSLGSINS